MDVLTSETCRAVNSEITKQVTSSWSIFIQLFCYKADLNVCVQQPIVTLDISVGNLSAFPEATAEAGKSYAGRQWDPFCFVVTMVAWGNLQVNTSQEFRVG